MLFCIVSKTEWKHASIPWATVTVLMVKRLIKRDASGDLTLTKQGRAVLAALLVGEIE